MSTKVLWRSFKGRRHSFVLPGLLSEPINACYDDGNQHSPQESRAVEYHLDTVSMTATIPGTSLDTV